MQEYKLAEKTISSVIDLAKENDVSRITKFDLTVGKFYVYDQEAFKELLRDLSKDTILEGAEFNLKLVPTVVRCPQCGLEKEARRMSSTCSGISSLICPNCKSMMEIIKGDDFLIENVEYKN